MKKLLMFIFALAAMAACEGNEEANLSVTTNEIAFDAKGTPQIIKVSTNQHIWRVDTDADWLTIDRDEEGNLTIGATSNPRKTVRTDHVYISANGTYQRILITQEGSLHEVGEPYPADNPVGIIYMTADGGEHGLVVSLDEMNCAWGPNTILTPEANSLVDGKVNTQAVIAAHKDESTFATDYPGFDWVNTLNNGSPNGQWFIPAYYQLIQMHQYLTGSNYIIPDPAPLPNAYTSNVYFAHADKNLRDRINAAIVELGGVPITYMTGVYWSSTENTAATADIFIFNDGRAYSSNGSTFQAKAAQDWSKYPAIVFNPVILRMRAILEF